MKNLVTVCLIFFYFLVPAGADSPPIRASSEVVATETPLKFGQPVELLFTVKWPEKSVFQPPEAATIELPEVEILDRYLVDHGSDGTTRSATYHLIFTRFEPGEFVLGPIALPAPHQSVVSPPIELVFLGATPKEGDKPDEIRAPKDVVELSTADFWKSVASWLLGLLSALLLLAALVSQFGLLDRFRSPKARALKELKGLKKRDIRADELVLGAAEILRGYLSEAYKLTTFEATSKEILGQMTLDNRCRALKPMAAGLLQIADKVKFAQHSVNPSEASDLCQNLEQSLREEQRVAK